MECALHEDELFRQYRSVEESKRSRIKNDSPEDEAHSEAEGSQKGKKIRTENGNVKIHPKLKSTKAHAEPKEMLHKGKKKDQLMKITRKKKKVGPTKC